MLESRPHMDAETERRILDSPATRSTVYAALALALDRDIVDVISDLRLAADILDGRFWRSVAR